MKMNHGFARTAALALACLGMTLGGAANAATVTATTEPFRLSIKHDGIRQSAGDETLMYSSQWDGGDGASVTIAQDGAALVEGLTGEGERTWTVTRNGTYVLTHTTYTNGVAGKVETATFVVTGKDVPFAADEVTVANYTGKYDGVAHCIGVTVADGITGAVVKYATAANEEFTTTEPTLTDVGSMTVWCEIAAPGYITQTNTATVTIAKREVSLTSGSASKVYDGSPVLCGDVIIAGDGFIDGEGANYNFTGSQTSVGSSENTFTYTLNEGTKAGNYDITTVNGTLAVTKATVGPGGGGSGGGDEPGVRVLCNGTDDVTANYTLAPYNGTLTVTRRPVTLTSKSASKPYDGTPVTCGDVLVAGDGFVPGEGATFNVTGSQTEKGTSKNSFTYTLTSGTNAAHYDITKVEGDLEVTAADISQGDEGDWQITFGPALTYTGLEQIQTLASVMYKGLPLDYSVTGNAQTDVGTYQMTLTGQGNFSGTHQVAWSIAPKALTLTAGSGSRVYDGTAFTVGTVTASGFVAGEGATYTCTGSQKDVGSSPNAVGTISWNANTKGSNYAVTKVAGTLTVTPRPATLTAANLSKPYDGTPLALTAADIAASGLVAGESFTYSDFASRTEAGQTPATFSYAAGPGTSLANYAVTVTAGRMITITKSATAISVTAASESWVYDGEAHSNRTWTATNLSTLQAGDELEVTFDEASVVTTPQDGSAQDGVVANVITGVRVLRSSGGSQSLAAEDVTANYTVEWFPGTLAVTKRPVTVTVMGHTATYTYDGEEKSVTGYDATTADTLYDIAADTAFGGIATTNRTDAGKSDMGLKAADFTNNDDCFDVTYAVTDGWVKIDPLDIAAAAGDEFAFHRCLPRDCLVPCDHRPVRDADKFRHRDDRPEAVHGRTCEAQGA